MNRAEIDLAGRNNTAVIFIKGIIRRGELDISHSS